MKNIAIIPARAGSKRITKKNILDFYGKPMIGWTIEAAINSGVFTKVLVSTDCEEIASISRGFGAEVPFLREIHCDDHSPVSLATYQAIIEAEKYWDEEYGTITQLMANCPMRGPDEISIFFDEFLKREKDFLLSCFKFGWMNPWWSFELDTDGNHEYKNPESMKMRSQDLKDLFCPSGAIWVARTEAFKETKSFRGHDHGYFEIDWTSAVDIDDMHDLEFAKAVYLLKKNR